MPYVFGQGSSGPFGESTSTSNFSFPKAEAIAIPAGPAPKTRTSGMFPFDIKYKSYD